MRDPELIKNILIKDYSHFSKNDFHIDEKLDPLLTKNPFFTTGESWKRGRSILLQMFTISKVRMFLTLKKKMKFGKIEFVKIISLDEVHLFCYGGRMHKSRGIFEESTGGSGL